MGIPGTIVRPVSDDEQTRIVVGALQYEADAEVYARLLAGGDADSGGTGMDARGVSRKDVAP
jgi:hypothetical protein